MSGSPPLTVLSVTIPQVGIGDDQIRSATVPGIDEALLVIGNAEGEASLAMACPMKNRSRWEERVFGAGIEARRACFEGH